MRSCDTADCSILYFFDSICHSQLHFPKLQRHMSDVSFRSRLFFFFFFFRPFVHNDWQLAKLGQAAGGTSCKR